MCLILTDDISIFYEMEVVHLDYINNVNNILFYLLNDNNNDLIQNSQERQSKISDQQIKNSKKLNKKKCLFKR